MRAAEWHEAPGPKPIRAWSRHAVAAGLVAAVLVALAVFGPPVTGQSIAPLLGLKHEILMMDRELERFSMRASASSTRAGTPVTAECVSQGCRMCRWSLAQFSCSGASALSSRT
jgi:hypothetical protein